MHDYVGQQFGNYRLIRLVGRGGFADVYLSEHKQLNTYAAIKVLHTHITNADIEKFRMEARTIARLVHPSIVRVFDFDVKEDTPFLVMDYLPNGTLRDRHPKGIPLPAPTIISYVKQIADALQYAHDERVIHRDIKPENMLLGRRNEVLLSDFGIAAIAHSTHTMPTQDRAGTISYMAPEQIQCKPRPASDQYALGIVVYEWLCGTPPFMGNYVQLMYQHVYVLPPSLREQIPSLAPRVEQVVLRALEKEPQNRFADVREFAQALEQANQATFIPIIKANPSASAPPAITITPRPRISPVPQTGFYDRFTAGSHEPVVHQSQLQVPHRASEYISPVPEKRSLNPRAFILFIITIGLLALCAVVAFSNHNWSFSPNLIVYLIVAAIVGLIAETIVDWRVPFSFVGAIIAAVIGIWLMTQVIIIIGIGDIFMQGVPIFRSFFGAIVFVALWYLVTYPAWRLYRRYRDHY